MIEEWEKIKNHPKYSCSNFGNIRNDETGMILNGTVNNKGYKRYDICENGKRLVLNPHRAVAEAFIPNPDNKSYINHIDGDKTNNNVSNLEWCTPKENTSHSLNVLGNKVGGLNKKAVICVETGILYPSQRAAELELNIPKGKVSSCCAGKRHSAKGLHFKYVEV